MQSQKFITVKEAADILRLNIITVYEYIKRGELKALKLGRNYRVEVREFNRFVKSNST